ncbi:HPr family phosphocarrier protein [Occultella gossypii]|uniref:Phosphocarrier protein HPr n=1 Tax=Occultella gossypii TaxID=2800820 RepID=A0ABS7S9C5_9MICO|nr:HPr family phosphocarrier protein [Occultella gossypii]MBZ2196949.1 HPr family phosphocarrier protein [Occultella gossypii]
MAERTATIGSPVGLHARPAAIFTRAAEDSGIQVRISKNGSVPQDAASILGVMTIGAKYGDTVTLHAEGVRAERVLDELAELLSRDLDA